MESYPVLQPSASSAESTPPVLGRTKPRLFTPPQRPLTPDTSQGFAQVRFAAEVLRRPFRPWQEFAVIHAGELLPDGRPRFRKVLVMVARQQGKTDIPVTLSLYWQFVECVPMTLGTSTKLDYAKESWYRATKLAERTPALDRYRPPRWTRRTNGEVESWTVPDEHTLEESRYKIAAANENAGRSLTVHRLIMDELRQHHDYTAWNAAEPTGTAVHDFQLWALSNAGDDRSVVLNDLREAALTYIETGHGDDTLCLLEWSCEPDADPTDLHQLAYANPELGRSVDARTLLANARKAVEKGGEVLTGFKTENMCIHVRILTPAIDPQKWADNRDDGTLDEARARVAMCLDVAPDETHATLYAAAVLLDGRVRVDFVYEWDSVADLEADLPELIGRLRPRVFGWLPGGPAAALTADLVERQGWPPAGVKVAEIRSEVAAVSMGFAAKVKALGLAHSGDPLLTAQVEAARKRSRRDGTWVFSRMGDGTCDAVYAAAGAVHLARTLPPPVGKPRVIIAGDQATVP